MKHPKKHHSDPIVGGESERESRPWGHGQFANLPQEARMQDYPKYAHMETPVIDDTAGRLAGDERNAVSKDRKNLDRGMY